MGERHVVDADEGDIALHVHVMDRADGVDGNEVLAREERGRRVLDEQQLAGQRVFPRIWGGPGKSPDEGERSERYDQASREVLAIAAFVLRRTVFGRYVYAVGSNPESARLAGVPVTRVLVSVCAIAGLLAAVGGVLFTSRLNAGIPTAGTGYELNASPPASSAERACSAPRAGRSAPPPERSSSAPSTTAATSWPSTRSTCRSSSAS
ncbi:MAG TPA: hypothetical protein VFY32_04505 [Solirubrobacteraceae bacterium]|nr:hypothetical protein [Solirubrobacteraceae bacterium]